MLKDFVVVSELGAQGKNFAARNILYIDKVNGNLVKSIPAGALDYRAGYSVVVGNEDLLVSTCGTQKIGETPPQISPQNRVICVETKTGETIFDFHIGPIFSEPLICRDRIYLGTLDGIVFCLKVPDAERTKLPDKRLIPCEFVLWQFKAEGAVNSNLTFWDENLYFGSNNGVVYCLDGMTGNVKWKYEVEEKEPRAFKFFSTPTIAEGRLYIGAANRRLYCFNAKTGQLIWEYLAEDWIRSRPVCLGSQVYAAALDGTIYCLSSTDEKVSLSWKIKVGTHPILSDLVLADNKILVNSSDLYLWCISADKGRIL